MSSFVKVVKKEFQSKSEKNKSEIEREKILNPYEKRRLQRLVKLKESKNNN